MTAWDEVALTKLSRVLGPALGAQLMTKVLKQMGCTSLGSAAALHTFGELLTHEPGFAAPVGGLLIVHATIHGATAVGSGSSA